MALFRCIGGIAPISVGTLVSSSASYKATEDGLYVHVAMGCLGNNTSWAGTISQSGGTVLYSYTVGNAAKTYSEYYQDYCLGIRIVYLAKGQTVSSTIGGGASYGTKIYKTIKLT